MWIRILALGLCGVLGACSSEESAGTPEEPASAGGSGGSDPVEAKPALYLSFLAEDGPGLAPAALRMFNDSQSQILSLTLPTGEAFSFYLVQPETNTEYALVASADMAADAILSIHTNDTCIRRPFKSIEGPMSLTPRLAYSIRVSNDLAASIVEEPAPMPFIGLRTIIHDPSLPTQVGAASKLSLSGSGWEAAFEDVYDELPAPHSKIDAAELVIDEVRFQDLAGSVHVAQGPFVIGDAPGYTAYLAATPKEGSAVVVELP